MGTSTTDKNLPPFRFLFTMAIGLGFGTTAITWTFYNTVMISFLEQYFQPRYSFLNNTFISFIMVWDNIIAIFLQPWIGVKSDNTNSRLGKRTPFILVGIPLAAFFFLLIPLMKSSSLILLILVILAFNMSMAIYRSPVVALMPDLTPTEYRSKANGVINMVGGVFAGIALFVGGEILKSNSVEAAFAFVSAVMIIALIGFLLLVKEPKELAKFESYSVDKVEPEKVSMSEEFEKLFIMKDKSKLFILLGIASWFMAWNALEIYVPTYIVQNIYKVPKHDPLYLESIGSASKEIGLVPIIFVVSTIIGGFLGNSYGRKPVIRIGLIIFFIGLLIGFTQVTITGVKISMFAIALAWGLINVNSIVIVWELSDRNIGAGTGIYYLFSSAAAIVGPLLMGAIFDFNDDRSYVWLYSLFWIILAFLFIFKVTSGEVKGKIDVDLSDLD
ncbi:MAG: MFS transporter [Candidatus Heimdallarchaeota archaeon]|nr:MFS transporter [Candidatus Heimdallarchaeota archaeon]MDH5644554.1 MFS transporter [Candidatus Heimdallarchaeota archaeon]